MEFSKYIELITEAEPTYVYPKRGGEYAVGGDKNKAIIQAIKERRMISFMYTGPRKAKKDIDGKKEDSVLPGKRVMVSPVALGVSKRGKVIVRCWIEPPTKSKKGYSKKSPRDIPNWRTYIVARMSDIKFTENYYDLNKLKGYKENSDKSMTVIYKSAKFSDKSEPKKITKPETKPSQKPSPSPTTKPEAKPKPTPIPSPVVTKPAVTPVPKPAPTKPEVKPKEKPKPQPEKKPETTKPKELPQVKSKEKPPKTPKTVKPDEEEMEPLMGLSETIKRMKTLMCK